MSNIGPGRHIWYFESTLEALWVLEVGTYLLNKSDVQIIFDEGNVCLDLFSSYITRVIEEYFIPTYLKLLVWGRAEHSTSIG